MRPQDRPHDPSRDPPAIDRQAAEALILEHLPEIAALCARLFRQTSDAEDATHEAVLAILRSLPAYRGDGPVRHFVLKVALNAARLHRRRRQTTARRETVLPEREPAGGEMTLSAEDRDERAAVRRAIAALPETLREPVVLHYEHHMTQTQIADVVGCSQKTVHVRLRKGLEHLERRLAGSPAVASLGTLGGLLAAGTASAPVFEPVAPHLLASVQQTIAGHFATAVAATAATAAPAGSSLGTAGATAGGIVMNAKLIAGAAILAVGCLVTGALVSGELRAEGTSPADTARIASLEEGLRTERDHVARLNATLARLEGAQGSERASLQTRIDRLERDLQTARAEAAAARDAATSSETASGPGRDGRSAEERWAAIQASIAGVTRILAEMEKEGANQFELGPQMVAELGKLSVDDLREMASFDADVDDPRARAEIRGILLQAFVFVPQAAGLRDDYMARYLDRVESGGHEPGFDPGALRRLAYRMPPFVDAYAKIVAPMAPELRERFVDTALKRAADGPGEAQRMDGVLFLGRTPGDRAADQLAIVARQPGYSTRLRVAAIRGLAERRSDSVLRALRDQEAGETDAAVKTALGQAAASVERLLATGE